MATNHAEAAHNVRWGFDNMREGETKVLPDEFGGLGRKELIRRVQKAKQNLSSRRGDILDITPIAGGIKVTMLSRVSPLETPRKERKDKGRTRRVTAAPAKRPAYPRPRKGTSTEGVRRGFWRHAFLKAMDNVPLADLPACVIIADTALGFYDKFVKESVSFDETTHGDDHHDEHEDG